MHTKNHRKFDSLNIPNKRYFTIGEISHLCHVEQHVLRYWEKEFAEIQPVRRGKRRYYQLQDIYLVRQINDLLKRQCYTIEGARKQLAKNNQAKQQPNYNKQILTDVRKMLEQVQAILKS